MTVFSQQRSKAARWIYERKDKVKWWRPSVLTSTNPDCETLNLSPESAYLIFADMVHAGLLLPVIADDGFDALIINPGREDEWKKAMNPRWHAARLGGSRLIEWIVSGIIGAVIGVIASSIAG